MGYVLLLNYLSCANLKYSTSLTTNIRLTVSGIGDLPRSGGLSLHDFTDESAEDFRIFLIFAFIDRSSTTLWHIASKLSCLYYQLPLRHHLVLLTTNHGPPSFARDFIVERVSFRATTLTRPSPCDEMVLSTFSDFSTSRTLWV